METIEKRIKHLIKSVNKVTQNIAELGKYHLKDKNRLILKYPRELEKYNKIVACGLVSIETYLREKLADLEEENKHFEILNKRRLV